MGGRVLLPASYETCYTTEEPGELNGKGQVMAKDVTQAEAWQWQEERNKTTAYGLELDLPHSQNMYGLALPRAMGVGPSHREEQCMGWVEVLCTAPPHAAGVVSLEVSAMDGGFSTSKVEFAYHAAAVLRTPSRATDNPQPRGQRFTHDGPLGDSLKRTQLIDNDLS